MRMPKLGLISRHMTVYTPAGYETNKEISVLYLLYGIGGDEEAWMDLGRASPSSITSLRKTGQNNDRRHDQWHISLRRQLSGQTSDNLMVPTLGLP